MKQLFIAVSVFALASCCSNQQSADQWTDAEIDQKIEEILPQLSLDEKVALCHAQSKFSTPGVARLGIPELWYSDGPHGVRMEINWDDWGHSHWTNDTATAFPVLTSLAASFNPDLAFEYGNAVAEEALYRGKDVMLGPGVNIYRSPLNGRNFEYMGEDPYLASVMAVPYIKGMQQNGVAACVKHFALNNQETWRTTVDVQVSDRALREIYLPAFEAAVREANVWSVMGSYNLYNGQHCCHNAKLNSILRNEWGFDGCVITDWGGATDTKESAENGLDIEMGTWTNGLTSSTANAYDSYYLAKPYLEAIKKGEIDSKTLDAKVRNILRLMFRTNMAKNIKHGRKGNAEHIQTALNIAREGIVLLKNDNEVLPLDAKTTKKIAVIGENATRSMMGGGSSELKTFHEVSPLEGIKSHFPNAQIVHSMGYASGPEIYGHVLPSRLNADSLQKAALEAVKDVDLVIFVGGLTKAHEQDCEGGDRRSLDLPFGQNELVEKILDVNKNMIFVLVDGNAVTMPWLDKVPAVVEAWYGGCEAGNAIADVLCGDVNPSGKLPYSFPVKLEDNAAHSFASEEVYPGLAAVDAANNHKETYKEDILVGYRWHDTKNIKPLFAFGYGLSYTTFEIQKADVKVASGKVNVKATIANTGKRDGAEVLQVYVGKPDSKVARAVKELKGFKKISIAAGASAEVSVDVPVEKLAFWNEESQKWEVEKGKYVVYVGTSSDNIAHTLEININ
ncbi:MAG: glycoside hydrolase family 3 C-terminal domain-containing protein [Bacteroidales bacterium]|nr:glycoside hydrolase family 3 C-terminal domain-containing protein [Bacteroidales bacterium]